MILPSPIKCGQKCYLTLSHHTSARIRRWGRSTDNFLRPGALAQRDRASERAKSLSQARPQRADRIESLDGGRVCGVVGRGLIRIGDLMPSEPDLLTEG